MVDWIFSYQLVFDDFVMWLVVGLLFLYILSQYYYLEGVSVAGLVFAAVIFAMAIKNEAATH